MAELVDALASGASVLRDVEVRTARRQFARKPSDDSYADNREVSGSRNVTKSSIIILEPLTYEHADVAELVDALASGASVLRDVEVQVLSSVPNKEDLRGLFCLVFGVARFSAFRFLLSENDVEVREMSEVKESSASSFLVRENGGAGPAER